jgi:hypothetical protein
MICFVCNLTRQIQDCVFCKELQGDVIQVIRYRYDAPNKYDQTEFGCIIRVNTNDDKFDIYRNVSREMNDPIWEYEGNFTEELRKSKYE